MKRIETKMGSGYRENRVINYEFGSLSEFYDYITETPVSNRYKYCYENKIAGSNGRGSSCDRFYMTTDWEQAVELYKHGWEDMAKRMSLEMGKIERKMDSRKRTTPNFDVIGYQASVPRYLQGIPTNMINKKQVMMKEKVITIVKAVAYLADVETQTIVNESMIALEFVKALENAGHRVNLDVMALSSYNSIGVGARVRIKSANERTNISKLAFPMVHPSFFRRMVFKFREVCPDTNEYWKGGYGSTCSSRTYAKALNDSEYFVPNITRAIRQSSNNGKLSLEALKVEREKFSQSEWVYS